MTRLLALAAVLLVAPAAARAQGGEPATITAEPIVLSHAGATGGAMPADTTADTATPEALLAALYDVISGPAGQPRDWARFRRLFAADGRLVALGRRPDGVIVQRTLTPDDYVRASGDFLVASGFTERETHRVIHRYGHVAHVFTAYEGTFSTDGTPGSVKGVNSVQMIETGGRWRILMVLWNDEATAGAPVPASVDRSTRICRWNARYRQR